MSEGAPPLIDLEGHDNSDANPSAPSNGSVGANGSTSHSIKDSTLNAASSTMASIQNHPVTENVKNAVADGPVGQSIKNQTEKTTSEFQDLADARKVPDEPTATGQPLTHYHSMFYRLLSWRNPRATSIAFAASIIFIFMARYLNIVRYTLKALYMVMGATALMEFIGKAVMGHGLATQFRPRRYFVIPKDSLERALDDVEQLINFFVIEFQRILFVENIWATVAAFSASFISYWLIKIVPLWGLCLIFDNIVFLSPLIYKNNREFIDAHLNHAGEVINAQATQVRDLAAQHTNRATSTMRSYAGEYTQKAQQMMGGIGSRTAGSTVKPSDFPNAPKGEPKAQKMTSPEPQLAH